MKVAGVFIIILVILFTFSLTITACDSDSIGSSYVEESIFIMTDIPGVYNGRYMYVEAWGQSKTRIFGRDEGGNLPQINNGRVAIPMWDGKEERYKGNETYITSTSENIFLFVIYLDIRGNSRVTANNFKKVTFKNGGAVKSWNDRMHNNIIE